MKMRYMESGRARSTESGYVLLAVMLTLLLMLIALSVEAPRIAQQIKRDKEEELVHRGKDYATAVKRFVHKNGGRYPASVEQLENTNHLRFLRKKYVDPITGESDWKMVHVGEAEVKIPAPNPNGTQSPQGTLSSNPRWEERRPRWNLPKYTPDQPHRQRPDHRRRSDYGRCQHKQETWDQRIQRQRRIRPVVFRV